MSRRGQVVLAFAGAAALAGTLIMASQLSARPGGPKVQRPPVPVAPFHGVAQRGNVLGRATAPITLVEYADLQCPYCGEWARRTLPALVDRYVRAGRLRIEFRGLAFIGPESQLALASAVAAGSQRRLWDVVDALYSSQGAENSGWVNESLVAEVAEEVGVDYERLAADRDEPWVGRTIASFARAATSAGVAGTPAFELGPTGGRLRLLEIRSLGPEGMTPAIEELVR